jgi:hypothetical protein
LIPHDGTTQAPPNTIGITVGNLAAGDRVLVARDNGSGGILTNQFTLASAAALSATKTRSPAARLPTVIPMVFGGAWVVPSCGINW